MGRKNCEKNFVEFIFVIYDLDYKNVLQNEEKATYHQKTLWFWKKKILKCDTIDKICSAIYFAVNFFFKVTHAVFLYTVYIFLYPVCIYMYIYIKYI